MNYFKIYEKREKYDFVIILSLYEEKWVFVKHKERDSYEIPGGHVEEGESVFLAGERELYEETGAIDYVITPIYGIENEKYTTMLFLANIFELGELPDLEIEEVKLFDNLPSNLTYPHIQKDIFLKIVKEFNLEI